jgi:hypothetical protein
MFKSFRDKMALSGVTVLMIGVALLIFTFISAYGFLAENLSIIASQDLVQTFGEALAPLIATCIRIMYLGVMGWAGSLLTIRGVTIIANAPRMVTAAPQPQKPITEQKPQPQPQKQEVPKPKVEKPKAEAPKEEKPKEEAPKPSEPQFVVIPPEEISQPASQPQSQPQTQPPPQKEEPQNNNSAQQPPTN